MSLSGSVSIGVGQARIPDYGADSWSLGRVLNWVCRLKQIMHRAPPHLVEMLQATIEGIGYELVGVELLSRTNGGHLLRIYIDADSGIGVTDCEKVSHQVSGVLEVEDPIGGDYALEVSSPGLDRPLFQIAHFARFAGEVARVKLNAAVNGRTNYRGTIVEVDGDEVVMQVDGDLVRLPFAQMSSARLVPQF